MNHVLRKEDKRLIYGKGKFVDDIKLPDMIYCCFIRSAYPHAKLKSININKAFLQNDVNFFTSRDFDWLNYKIAYEIPHAVYLALAKDKVRFVGEPVAVVVAPTPYLAEDATESIEVEYEPLKPVSNIEEALSLKSKLYEELNDNMLYKRSFEVGDVQRAFDTADFIVSKTLKIHRQTPAPIETRGFISAYDEGQNKLTCWTNTQDPHVLRTILSYVLSLPESNIRIIAPDIGGAFGQKHPIYPEEIVTAALSIMLKRPVKWIEKRRENFLSSVHSREQIHQISVAVKRSGKIIGVKDKILSDFGAYIHFPHHAASIMDVALEHLLGPYDIKNIQCELLGVATNKTPHGAYRGYGRPEANFALEHTINIIANELKISPIEIRMDNLPESFPYKSATGLYFDSGDYIGMLNKAAKLFEELQRDKLRLQTQGKCAGVGVSLGIEKTAPALERGEWSGNEYIRVCINSDGSVTVKSGLVSLGTGLETVISQLVAKELDIDVNRVKVYLGDTDESPFSCGVWGGRSAVAAAVSIKKAVERLKQKILMIASYVLDVAPTNLELKGGQIITNKENKSLDLAKIANIAWNNPSLLPKGIEPGLEEIGHFEPASSSQPSPVSYMCDLALVDVDTETFEVKILKYVSLHDSGVEINSMIVEGQLIGGIVQGLGGALFEEILYNNEGQPLTLSFADYAIPSALEIPWIQIIKSETPSPLIPGGLKGCGEAGVVPVYTTIASAIEDALDYRIEITDLPLSSYKLWSKIKVK